MNSELLPADASASEVPAAGAPIFALHGTASTSSQWLKLREACHEHREFISPELPGYGTALEGSGPGLDSRLTPLLPVFLAMHTPVHLVGHSFGGALALRLAEIHPDRVLSVSIYEPTSLGVFQDISRSDDRSLLRKMQELGSHMACAQPRDAMARFIDFWMGPGNWDALGVRAQDHLAQYATIAARDFQDGLHEAVEACARLPFAGPVLLLYGDRTIDVTRRVCQSLAASLPCAALECLADSGHMGPIQNADRVNSAILAHIEAVERTVATPVLQQG